MTILLVNGSHYPLYRECKNRARRSYPVLNLFLLFEFAEGCFLLGSGKQALNIGSVHKDGQQADQYTDHRHHRLLPMEHRKAYAKCGRTQNRTQGYIAGEIQTNGKDRQDDQRAAPIGTQRNGESADDALSPVETQQSGKIMAQADRQCAKHQTFHGHTQRHKEGLTDQAGGNRLADVDEQHPDALAGAKLAHKVGQTCVAAAGLANILMGQQVVHDERAVQISQEITDYHCE